MKRIILISMLLVMGLQGFSQQDPQYTLYMFNPLAVNPAYAGSREVLSAVLVHRSQWLGLDGAPETQAFAINTPLRNKKMGLGLQIVNDKIGPKTTQNITGAYAYRLKLGNGKLALGLKAGIINYNFDWSKVEYQEEEDVIQTESQKGFLIPTVDFGIYYNTRTFYAGIAAEHLNQSSFDFAETQSTDTIQNGNSSDGGGGSKKDINFIATAGKAFTLNDNFVLKTSILGRYANGAGNVDVNISVLIKNKILFGASVRANAVIVLTELNISKKLRMGIGYDIETGGLSKSTTGSFEIFIGYDVGLFKSKVVSPRYF